MKKFIFLALISLFTLSGLSSKASPVKEDFDKISVLKHDSVAGDVFCEIKTNQDLKINFTTSKDVGFKIIDLFKESTLTNKTTFSVLNERNYNFKSSAVNDVGKLSGESYSNKNSLLGFRTVWDSYQDYLRETGWRINVKKIRYDQLLLPTEIKS